MRADIKNEQKQDYSNALYGIIFSRTKGTKIVSITYYFYSFKYFTNQIKSNNLKFEFNFYNSFFFLEIKIRIRKYRYQYWFTGIFIFQNRY